MVQHMTRILDSKILDLSAPLCSLINLFSWVVRPFHCGTMRLVRLHIHPVVSFRTCIYLMAVYYRIFLQLIFSILVSMLLIVYPLDTDNSQKLKKVAPSTAKPFIYDRPCLSFVTTIWGTDTTFLHQNEPCVLQPPVIVAQNTGKAGREWEVMPYCLERWIA